MNRMAILLLTAALAWTALPCRADDSQTIPVPTTGTSVEQSPTAAPVENEKPAVAAPAAPAEKAAVAPAAPAQALAGDVSGAMPLQVSEGCAPACEAPCHTGALSGIKRFQPTGQCVRKLCDWLSYRPQCCPRACSNCGRTCAPTCVPPLYTYFTWQCEAAQKAGHCGAGCANVHDAPVMTEIVPTASPASPASPAMVPAAGPEETPQSSSAEPQAGGIVGTIQVPATPE